MNKNICMYIIKYLLILATLVLAKPKLVYIENSNDTTGYSYKDSLYWRYDKHSYEKIYSKSYLFSDTIKIEILGEDTTLELYNDTITRSIEYENSDAYDLVKETYSGLNKKEEYVRKLSYCNSDYADFPECPYIEHLIFQKDTTTIIDTCYYQSGEIKKVISYKEKEKFFYPEEHTELTRYDNLFWFNGIVFDKKGKVIGTQSDFDKVKCENVSSGKLDCKQINNREK